MTQTRTILARALCVAQLVSALGFACVLPTHATTAAGIVGNGTRASCTEAALSAALTTAGTVTFDCGGPATIALSSKLTVGPPVTIDGGGVITISGELRTRIFEIGTTSALTLTNLVLTQALSLTGDGGAILNNGRLHVDGVTFTHNSIVPTYSGAAIMSNGAATILNSVFAVNDAGSAGAIFVNGPAARVTISNALFVANRAVNSSFGYGGALWVGRDAQVEVINSAFRNNIGVYGGAIFVTPGGRLWIRGSGQTGGIDENQARLDGGGIYNSGILEIERGVFRRNRTPTEGSQSNYGGAIANLGTLHVRDGFFRDNESRFGGAIFTGGQLSGSRAEIVRTLLTRNRAVVFGGGLYANVISSTVLIDQSAFTYNSAGGTGGGIGRMNAAMTISNSTISFNTALNGGAGVFAGAVPNPAAGASMRIVNTTISDNTSENKRGGGILNTTALLEIVHATIVSNTQGIDRGLAAHTALQGAVLHNPGHSNCVAAASDSESPISDSGGNFATDLTCSVSTQGTALNPMLGPYRSDPMTPVEYYMPLSNSPLLRQAKNCPPKDARGVSRTNPCAIGAVEYSSAAPPSTLANLYLPMTARGQ